MKKILFILSLLYCTTRLSAQNTYPFPSTGNVGIGTTSPVTTLQVAGITTTNLLSLSEGANLLGYLGRGGSITSALSSTPEILGLMYMKRDFAIGGWGKTDLAWHGISFYINSDNGYVGIGTTSPQESLSVNGNIRSKQVKVEATNWPDYVFEDKYSLKPLPELEKYLIQNKHLPDMPSAQEVESKGQNLGEINSKLLKNLEELTLHLIEKDKQIQQQQTQLDLQQTVMTTIQVQLKQIKSHLKNSH